MQKPKQTTKADLVATDALIIGSPNWTGIKGSLKLWLDTTGDLWEEGTLADKIGAAFTASDGRHSGTEFTLLNVLHWMLGNGMLIVGLPWTPLMQRAGSYYGATAYGQVTEEDLAQARAGPPRGGDGAAVGCLKLCEKFQATMRWSDAQSIPRANDA